MLCLHVDKLSTFLMDVTDVSDFLFNVIQFYISRMSAFLFNVGDMCTFLMNVCKEEGCL